MKSRETFCHFQIYQHGDFVSNENSHLCGGSINNLKHLPDAFKVNSKFLKKTIRISKIENKSFLPLNTNRHWIDNNWFI